MGNKFYAFCIRTLVLFVSLFVYNLSQSQIINTVVGNGTSGYSGDGGPATDAGLVVAEGVAPDAYGNYYVADRGSNRVRKVNAAGIITTIAGNGSFGYTGDGGPATAGTLNTPCSIGIDAAGNVYIGDWNNHVVRKVSTSGIISTFAGNGILGFSGDGGPATSAKLQYPFGIAADASGNIYIGDYYNYRVRKVSSSGLITTFAGNGTNGYTGDGGPATAAALGFMAFLAVDNAGNVYFDQSFLSVVRVVNSSGIIHTFAGSGTAGFGGDGGPATAALLHQPYGVAADPYGNIYINDFENERVRKVSSSGIINTIAGNGIDGFSGDGGPATACEFLRPFGLAVDDALSVYVADYGNARIRKIVYNPTRPPHFTHGHRQTMTVCADTSAVPINSLLAIVDSDLGQTETWTTVLAPAHGSLSLPHSAVSTGAVLTPAGITYRPSGGSYSGLDSFRVRVSDGTASDTTTVVLTINPSPAPILGYPSTCADGGTTTLAATLPGGSWNSGDYSIATVGTGTGVVTGGLAGTTTITYTLGTGCRSVMTVTINPLPAPISGVTTICIGYTTTLSDVSTGGVWTSAIPSIASVGTGVGIVTGVAIGNTNITYTLPTGCRNTVNITVYPNPPAISGASTLCIGAATSLGDSYLGGTWTSNNAAVAPVITSTGLVSGLAIGTATITYMVSTGCFNTVRVTVTALPPAISGSSGMCPGTITALSDGTSGGTWSSSNLVVATIGSSSGVLTGLSTGTARITYSLGGSCRVTIVETVFPTPAVITGTMTVCPGATSTLHDATTGGTWASRSTAIAIAGSATGVVSGITTGTTIITYKTATGCVATATITVKPNPSAITGAMTVCMGNTTALSDGTPGGSWSSSRTAIASISTASGVVTGIAIGTSIITYTVATGCPATTTLTVTGPPAVIVGSSAVCVGAGLTLSDATSGGSWTSSATGVVTIGSTGTISGISAGTARITYSLGMGCFSSKTISVLPDPLSITGSAAICVGTSTTLHDATSGGVWTSSRTTTATVGSGTGNVTGVSTGSAIITYALASGCFTTATITVVTSPAPISGPSTVLSGAAITLTDAMGGGTWSSSRITVATVGSSTGVVTGISMGTSTITYSLGTGCATTKTITVSSAFRGSNASGQGIDSGSIEPVSLEVFPDPNKGVFNLVIHSDKDETVQVFITNSQGARVKEFMSETNIVSGVELDVPPGIYIVSAVCGGQLLTRKVVISR